MSMIALDTNVILRFLVRDDDRHYHIALGLLQRISATQASCFISVITACELVWILTRRYKQPRDAIASLLDDLLATGGTAEAAALFNVTADFTMDAVLNPGGGARPGSAAAS